MTATEGAAFLAGLGSGMVSVGGVVLVFDAPPVAFVAAGLLPIGLSYAIEWAEGGEGDR